MGKRSNAILVAQEQYQSGRLHQAEATCLEILRLEPEHFDVLLFLGVIANQLGESEKAIEWFTKAVAVKPDHFETYKNLGFLLRRDGKLEAAAENYRKALLLKPDYVEAHSGLGDVLSDQERLDEAIASYQMALLLRPDFAEVYSNLGGIYLVQGKLDEALEACQMALALSPRFAEAYVNLGAVLLDQGRTDAAVDSFRKALELKPNCAMAHEGLAAIHVELGNFDAAQQELTLAIESNPESATALSMLPDTKKMSVDDVWLSRAQRLVSEPMRSAKEAIRLHSAIGKYLDDIEQYDDAFFAYEQANALRRKLHGGFDRVAFSGIIDALISIYPSSMDYAAPMGSNPSRRPVVIVGMPRSGTSLVEQIIASHPQAFGAGELGFWDSQVKNHWKTVSSGKYDSDLAAEIAAEYEQLLKECADGKDRVVDKMPENFLWLGLIRSVFPNARIIHLQRDPLDTCLSIHFQHFLHPKIYAADLEDLGYYYLEYLRITNHWRKVIPADGLLEISYEDLIADPLIWCKRIIEFIELPWDARCLSFHKTERRVETASSWSVRQPIFKTSVGRWKNYQKHLGPLMKALDGGRV